MDHVQQSSAHGELVLLLKGNDYAAEAGSITIAKVVERKVWVIYIAGLIFRISARGLLRILERLGILEKLRDVFEVTNCSLNP